MSDSGFGISDLGFWVQGLSWKVEGSRGGIQSLWSLEFRAWGNLHCEGIKPQESELDKFRYPIWHKMCPINNTDVQDLL